MKEFVFTWRIENINYAWHKTNENILSPLFTAGPIENSSWALQLKPRGEYDPDFLSVFLGRGEDNGTPNLSINCELDCISAENLPLKSFKFKEADNTFPKNGCGFGHPRFLRRHEVFIQRKALYLPQDVLTLRCRMWKDESSLNEFGQSFARTQLTVERISSVAVMYPGVSNVSIHSKLQNKTMISIDISNYDDATRIVIIPMDAENAKFSILKISFMDKTTGKNLCEHRSSWLGVPRRETWWLQLSFRLHDSEKDNLINGNVEVQSEFVYSTGEEIEEIQEFEKEDPSASNTVGKIANLPRITEDLWNSSNFRDVYLKTPSNSFHAHKFVLCARSPVFLAMLTGDMKEKFNGSIEIDDIGDDILEKFLYFLYTDTFKDLDWDAVINLYYAADKYQVGRLKLLCCGFFLENINVDNVCELLMLADKHQDSDLKASVEDFILQNDQEVFGSLLWKKFVKEQPFLPALTMILKYDKERGKVNDGETYETKLMRLPNVQDDFAAAYRGGMMSDVTIKTGNSSFHAHRSILCVSSIVLREKLSEPTETFEIPDFEEDIVSRLLLFLYTDSLSDVQWDAAIKLYHAADVYQIQRLKAKCSCFLLENLSISNATELLLKAHDCKDVQLKSLVEDYIFLHDEEIFGSDQWADFSETNFRLANETMRLKYRRN